MSLEEIKKIYWDTCPVDWGGTIVALANPEAIYHHPATAKNGTRPFSTVKCYAPNQPEWTLWFDASTHLLEQIQYNALEATSLKSKHLFLSDFSSIDGVLLPKKFELRIGGVTLTKLTVSLFEPLEKLDAKMFTEPPSLR